MMRWQKAFFLAMLCYNVIYFWTKFQSGGVSVNSVKWFFLNLDCLMSSDGLLKFVQYQAQYGA